jgi:hypothetical protein
MLKIEQINTVVSGEFCHLAYSPLNFGGTCGVHIQGSEVIMKQVATEPPY